MSAVTLAFLRENLELGEQLLAGRDSMFEPQDLDIVLSADRIEEFLNAAALSGFEVLPQPEGRWPKVRHKDTDVKVDILPENARPGTADKPAPTTIRPPLAM